MKNVTENTPVEKAGETKAEKQAGRHDNGNHLDSWELRGNMWAVGIATGSVFSICPVTTAKCPDTTLQLPFHGF